MTKRSLIKIFWRSFFIQTALNFRRMQNLGFVYAMIPIFREQKLSLTNQQETLLRHLQMFNTHPYLAALLIGSLARLEEDRQEGESASPIMTVKQSMMGPYAAIGDTFFWGSLRPCAGIFAAALAWWGAILAPLAFLSLFFPAHFWIRVKGFVESYRRGRQGIDFIRKINLPGISGKVRYLALAALCCFGIRFLYEARTNFTGERPLLIWLALTTTVLLCWLLIKKGISQIYLLYAAAILLFIFSLKDL